MLPRYFRRAAQGGVIRTQGSGYFGSPTAFAAAPGLRLDEHAGTIKAALPELKHRPSEYVKSGRYSRASKFLKVQPSQIWSLISSAIMS